MGKLEDALDRMGAVIAARSLPPRPRVVTSECQARQYSDSMFCKVCGVSYDVNDPDPPLCRVTRQPARGNGGPGRK